MYLVITFTHICRNYTHLQKYLTWEITQQVCRLKGTSNREGETDDVEERC